MRDLTCSVNTLFAPAFTEEFPVQSHPCRIFVIGLPCGIVILRCQSPKILRETPGATDELEVDRS